MKKIFFLIKIILLIFISIIIIATGLYYVQNNNISIEKIILSGKINNKLQKLDEEDSISLLDNLRAAVGITTIDLTGLATGENANHTHIYVSTYDNTNHWQYCKICNKIQNQSKHKLTRVWASGHETCDMGNYYTDTCECGYIITGRKPHVWDGKTYGHSSYSHSKLCSECKNHIVYAPYYMYSYGNGNLIYPNNEIYSTWETCSTSNNKKINCDNLGTCAMCNKSYSVSIHSLSTKNDEIICSECNKPFGMASLERQYSVSNNIVTNNLTVTLKLKNGAIFKDIRNYGGGAGSASITTNTSSIISNSATETKLRYTVAISPDFNNYVTGYCYFTVQIDGKNVTGRYPTSIIPDIEKPKILSISQTANGSTWQNKDTIKIIGTENYSDTVAVTIKDDTNTEIYKGSTKVNNKTFSLECTPDVEADEIGREFTVIAEDKFGNSTSQKFRISKVDCKVPTMTSSKNFTGSWTQTRRAVITAKDEGVGNVQIGFNSESEYQVGIKSGIAYSRTYDFIGDVYGTINTAIYLKDGLNNVTTELIQIGNIDNTKPTITSAIANKIVNEKIRVEIVGHDRHITLGEGSGIKGYYYIVDSNAINDFNVDEGSYVTARTIDLDIVNNGKYVHIKAIDNAGNISSVRNVNLNIQSNVVLNANGGILEENIETKTLTGLVGKTVDLGTPIRNGYTFIGWNATGGVISKNIYTYGVENGTAIAQWRANTYTVVYNGNGTITGNTEDSNHIYDESQNLTTNKFERKYTVCFSHNYEDSQDLEKVAIYKFKNWNTKEDGTGISFRDSSEVKNLTFTDGEIINLYAIWEPTSVNYIPVREGYIFKGWYSDKECTNKVTENEYIPTEDITLYAKWEKDIDLEETISIELTKKWIDNNIQRLRRPDKIKFVVTPYAEAKEEGVVTKEEVIPNKSSKKETDIDNRIQNNADVLNKENSQEKKEEISDAEKTQDINNLENVDEKQDENKSGSQTDRQGDLDTLEKAEKTINENTLKENNTLENITINEVIKSRMTNRVSELIEPKNVNSESKIVDGIQNQQEGKTLNSEETISTSKQENTNEDIRKVNTEENTELDKQQSTIDTEKLDETSESNEEDKNDVLSELEENDDKELEQVNESKTSSEGEEVEYYVVEFIENVNKNENTQIYTLELPKYNKETLEEIKYIITEEEVNEGDLKFYEATGGEVEKIADSEGNIIKYKAEIINKFKLPENNTKEVKVTKVWNDDNQITTRPISVILELIGRVKDIQIIEETEVVEQQSDAEEIVKITETPKQEEQTNEIMPDNNNEFYYKTISSKEGRVSAELEWKHIYTGLPIYDENGQEIEYIAQEKKGQTELDKYISEVSKINELNEIIVTNNLIIRNSIITKTGLEEITSVDSNVPYNIDYETELDNKYIENVAIEIVDTLPYQIDEEKSDLKGGVYNYNEETKVPTITWEGTYNPVSKIIIWENTIEENNLEVIENAEKDTQTIKVHIDMNVTYKNINVLNEKIVNKVSGKVTLSNNVEEKVESTFETRTRWIRNITVTKLWKGDTEETRPESIELQLSASIKDENNQNTEYILDESIETTKTLSKDTNWTEMLWTNLPSYDESGKEINYTVQEIDIDGYKSEILEINKNLSDIEITIQNTKLYKLPITGGIGVDTIRSLEVLLGIILLIVLTNRKKVVPSRRSVK